MNDNISPEKGTGARAVLTTEKITSVFGKKERPAIGVQKIRPGQTSETRAEAVMGEPDIYLVEQSGRKNRSKLTVFGSLEALYEDMVKKAKQGLALTEKEMENLNGWFTKLPGVDRWDLGRYTGEMINQASKRNPIEAQNNWEAMKDVDERIKMRRENPQLALIWDYVEIHGGDPEKIKFDEVIAIGSAIEAIEKGEKVPEGILKVLANRSRLIDKDRVLRKMKGKENKGMGEKGGWKDEETKLKAYEYMLGMHQKDLQVDVQKFWKERFLEVIEARLAAMRSPVSARLVDKEGDCYLRITRSRDLRKLKHEGDRIYASQLGKTTLASNTEIGKFLDEMHQGEYWRGKAFLDHLYWRIYMGELVDESEAMKDETMSDIFARLNSDDLVDSHFRAYTSTDALSKFIKDKDFTRALNVLYTLPLFENGNPQKPLSQEQRLQMLAQEMGFDSTKDLPQSVTDAVMFSQVFALDAKHLSSSDRRYTVYFLAEHYHKQAAKVGGQIGELWAGPGGVLEVLGYNFKLTESPLLMMGFVSPINLRDMDYHALVPDSRSLDPEKYPDQLNKVWQNIDFYCLQQRDPTLRRRIPQGSQPEYHVGVGEMGEYCVYDNDRQDHRAGVFKRFVDMFLEDNKLLRERGQGKGGWDRRLRRNVVKVLDYLRTSKDLTISGVQIQTNGQEIFFNDALEKLLEEYEHDKLNEKYRTDRKDLNNLLRMRNVLQDHRAWGTVWSLDVDEEEMFSRQEDKKDLMLATVYNYSGKEARDAVLDLINIAPFQSMYEMNITPAEIFERIRAFGHRFQSTQQWHTMYKLYAFASTVIEMRMTQMEVPSADSLDEATSPMGKIKIGAWGEKMITPGNMKVEGAMVEAEKQHEEIYKLLRGQHNGERLSFSYLEHMSRLRLLMIERGFYRGWDEALARQVSQALTQEWLRWDMVNMEFTLKSRGWLYEYLAKYHDKFQPVRSNEIPDVAVERDGNGRIINVTKRDLLATDVTMKEAYFDRKSGNKGLYFEWISTEEAGEIFGGVRNGVAANNLMVVSDRSKKAQKVGTIAKGGGIEVLEIRGDWARVSQGWVRINGIEELGLGGQEESSPMLENETLFEGGRLVWFKPKDEKEKGEWRWVQGEWFADSFRGIMVFVKQGDKIEVDSAERFVRINSGAVLTKSNKIVSVVGGFEKDGLRQKGCYYLPPEDKEIEDKGKKEQRLANEARFPFMIWRTDKPVGKSAEVLRKEFYDHRMHTLFRLQFGRTEGVLAGGQQAIALDRKHFQSGTAGGMDLIRGWYFVQTQMRTMERVVCAREMYKGYLKSVFHVVTKGQLYEGVTEALDDFIAKSRLWGIDQEVMEKYAAIFPTEWVWQKNPRWRLLHTILNTEVEVLSKLVGPKWLNFTPAGALLTLGGAALGIFALPALVTPLAIAGFVLGNAASRNIITPWIYKNLKPIDPSMIRFYDSKHREVRAVITEHLKFKPVQ